MLSWAEFIELLDNMDSGTNYKPKFIMNENDPNLKLAIRLFGENKVEIVKKLLF